MHAQSHFGAMRLRELLTIGLIMLVPAAAAAEIFTEGTASGSKVPAEASGSGTATIIADIPDIGSNWYISITVKAWRACVPQICEKTVCTNTGAAIPIMTPGTYNLPPAACTGGHSYSEPWYDVGIDTYCDVFKGEDQLTNGACASFLIPGVPDVGFEP